MKQPLLIIAFVLLFCNGAMADDAVATYYVPPAQFNAQIQVMDLGFSNIFALFQNATSSFNYNDSSKSISRLRIAIDATSLITSNGGSQRDLSSLLDNSRYGEISITAPDSTSFTDSKATLKGTITLHGVSKPVTLEATLNHVGKSPTAGGMWSHQESQAAGLSLRTSLKRADFGMGDDPNADAPGRFGDTMTLMMEMQAIRQ